MTENDCQHITIKQTRRVKPIAWLVFSLVLLYGMTSPGNIPGDTETRWEVARQVVCHGTVALSDTFETRNYAVGVDGRRYSFYGLGQSILLMPFVGLSLAAEHVGGLSAEKADLAGQLLASVVLFPAIGGVLVWLFYKLILAIGYSERVGLMSATMLGAGTMVWHYVTTTQEQPQIALLLILAVLFLERYQKEGAFKWQWLFCVMLGMCLLFRLTTVVMIFPMFMAAMIWDLVLAGKAKRLAALKRWIGAGVIGTGGFILFCLWFNYSRFGNPLESGYGVTETASLGDMSFFDGNPLANIAAMLFSPGKSLFLYNPVLIIAMVGMCRFCRTKPSVAVVILAAVVGNLGLYCFFSTWAGDYAWCIRYQMPILPFLMLPVVAVLSWPWAGVKKWAMVVLFSLSLFVQLGSVVYNFNLEFVQNPNHGLVPGEYVWDWQQSHLRNRFTNIYDDMTGQPSFESVPVIEEKPKLLIKNTTESAVRFAYAVNFFPFKAKAVMGRGSVFWGLLALWCVMGAMMVCTFIKFVQRSRILACR